MVVGKNSIYLLTRRETVRYFYVNGTGYACVEYTMIPAKDGFFIRLLGTDMRCFFLFPKIE